VSLPEIASIFAIAESVARIISHLKKKKKKRKTVSRKRKQTKEEELITKLLTIIKCITNKHLEKERKFVKLKDLTCILKQQTINQYFVL